jgi:hypothetical protein
MSGQCSLASQAETASDNLSLQSLHPFFGDPCDDGSMHVCAAAELNYFLSSHPLTTIRHMKYGKQRQKYEYRHCRCVAPSGLMFVIQLMAKSVMLMWVLFLMTTLMWMKILIIGIRTRKWVN